MNRTKLKNYAPQARREFIQAVTQRAAVFGLTPNKIEPVVEKGDVAIIGGTPFPKAIAAKRRKLEERIKRDSFEQTMEALAYTWFNRFVAIRYMELHQYLEHGYRVLSHPDLAKPTPEILEQAEHVALPGVKKDMVVELKLAGDKEAELYRLLLVAQCNALHSAMPFLFEKIDDETELVLPENLLHSDSILRKLVSEIDEEDWQRIEIVGWLYQFYISEKKEQVIGKVVKSEDIPAATQLFTPNWIVKYLVQNSLGRQWLATYPQSALRQQMEYYIEPAEQTPEVDEQLRAITPESLNPEELTLLDPACGSGHILVEAYDLFKAIYRERGYRAKDIPALILQKNLFGLEIDDRAAQLAAFALMMKARADDRRIFDGDAKPNIVAIHESKGLDAAELTHAINSPVSKEKLPQDYLFEEIQEEKDGLFSKKALAEKGQVSESDIASLLTLFEYGKTFGSLIQVPSMLAAKLPEIERRLDDVLKFGDLTHASAHVLKPLLRQAGLLARQYDAVAANPPYMGRRGFSSSLASYVDTSFADGKENLFAVFLLRAEYSCCKGGSVAFVTMHNWMFLSRFETFRRNLLDSATITSLIHLGPGAFPEITGEVVQTACFVLHQGLLNRYQAAFLDATSLSGDDKKAVVTNPALWHVGCKQGVFRSIAGEPLAYWLSDRFAEVFSGPSLGSQYEAREGMTTGSNAMHVRQWHELSVRRIAFGKESRSVAAKTGAKWFPYNKGGEFQRWFGNIDSVVNWQDDGRELQTKLHPSGKRVWAHNFNLDFIFREGITWTDITSTGLAVRYMPQGCLFDATGLSAFAKGTTSLWYCLALGNSIVSTIAARALNPTLHFKAGDFSRLPMPSEAPPGVEDIARSATALAKTSWDSSETSWEFATLPILEYDFGTLQESQSAADEECLARLSRLKQLEEENNRLFIEAYGLQDELSPEVPDDQITLYRPDREEDIKRLLSYAVGCMMGRYSLDKPGLIYANSGNHGFDPYQYEAFQVDDDGVIPLLETDWGLRDDAVNRIVEFLSVAWPKEQLEENVRFVADSLGPNAGEQPRETIRRYLATGFYKHHLSMYKKRPIYWLFSSGKQRAFQCLVYLHRYHEGTLARIRTEYVIPLQGKLAARIEQLASDALTATSTSHRKKLDKEREKLLKQQVELQAFDEKLRHYADQRIALDLDDGVKVNYAKFGDLLAEVKAVTGGKED